MKPEKIPPFMPRIFGRVGQCTDPEPGEFEGKWFFEVFVTLFKRGEETPQAIAEDRIGQYGPYETEAEAQTGLVGACRMASERMTEAMTGEKSGHYFDMKDGGKLKAWDKK